MRRARGNFSAPCSFPALVLGVRSPRRSTAIRGGPLPCCYGSWLGSCTGSRVGPAAVGTLGQQQQLQKRR